MNARIIVAAALAGGLAFGIAAPAQAASSVCSVERVLVSAAVAGTPAVYGEASVVTPAVAAWVERALVSPAVAEQSHVVHHDAQYAERLVIDQEYAPAVPAVEEVSHVVSHPAVTKTVRHAAVTETVKRDAETTTVYHPAVTTTDYTRYSWVGGGSGPQSGNTPLTSPRDWQANGKKYDGSPTDVVQQGNGKASYFFWAAVEVVTEKAWDEIVTVTPASEQTITVSEAWDETVVVTEAWDEKIVDVAAQSALPAREQVSHTEYDLVAEAWDETVVDVEARDAVYREIAHPAQEAILGERPLIAEAIPTQDAVYEEATTCSKESGAVEEVEPRVVSAGDITPSDSAVLASTETGSPVPDALALTGGGIAPVVPLSASALILGGLAMLVLRRRGGRATQD